MFVLAVALAETHGEPAGPLSTLAWGALVILLGIVIYPLARRRQAAINAVLPESE
jgi:hypothetical protein